MNLSFGRPCDASFLPYFLIEINWKHFQVPQGHVVHHSGHQEWVPGGVHQVFHEPFFCDTSFMPSFWIEIDWKYFQVPQGHFGHHSGHWEWVHQVDHEPFLLPWDTTFWAKERSMNYFMYSSRYSVSMSTMVYNMSLRGTWKHFKLISIQN